MLTEIDRTRRALSQGPLYANWNSKEPRRVWVIEHKSYAYHALETKPVEGFPGLVWALVEAMSVSRSDERESKSWWSFCHLLAQRRDGLVPARKRRACRVKEVSKGR